MKETGGSMFAFDVPQRTEWCGAVQSTRPGYKHEGLTIRDYFAAKAMAALFDSDAGHNEAECRMIAREAYTMADIMLEERAAK